MNEDIKFLTVKPTIIIEQVVGWEYALEAARFTQGKEALRNADGTLRKPSEKFIKESLMAEHGHIKVVQYKITIKDLAQWIGVHFLRHAYTLPYICTQRNDLNESVEEMVNRIVGELLKMIQEEEPGYNPRNLLPQGTRNDHMFWMNAQTIINISKRRMCSTASKETREVWRMILAELAKVDPVIAWFCVPMCVYRGFCPERECCGYVLSRNYIEHLISYRALIAKAEERVKKK